MKRLLAAALALAATSAAAQQAPPLRSAPAAEDEAAHRLFDQAEMRLHNGDLAGGLALLDQALALLPEPSAQRGYLQCARGMAHLPADMAVARPAIEECRRLVPNMAIADMADAELMFADRRIEPAAQALVRMVRTHPDAVISCDTSDVGEIPTWLRVLNYAKLDALRGELIEGLLHTPCGQDDAAFFSGLARQTIVQRVVRGDRAGAAGLLPVVIDPDDLLMLLIDRRLDPIRAELEKRAGSTLEPQREALLQSARNAVLRSHGYVVRNTLGSVLGRTGHREEAIAALDGLLDDPATDDPAYLLRATTASRLADLRSQNGETDVTRVVAPMRRLLAMGSPHDKQGLWNVVPNLALWLLNYGRPREALAVIDQYGPKPGDFEAPAAYAYFTALRGCAQFKLDDPQGRATLDSVEAEYPSNFGARRLAVLCGPDGAAQRATLLAIAADPDDTGPTLVHLIRLRTLGAIGKGPVTFEDAAMLRALADPDFAARLDALTRPLAPSYRGALAHWN